MSSASEKTPLVGGEQGGFYFVPKRTMSQRGDDMTLNGAAAAERKETEPLVVREREPVESVPTNSGAEAPARGGSGGGGPAWWPFRPKAPIQSAGKLRKVPVKVEPKVFFSNERTFIAWMHMAVTLSTIAIAIIAFADHNAWSQVYGLILLPVAIAFIVYALWQYMRRARLIRQRAPGPYEDNVGPALLATMLMVAIIMNFAIKVYELYG